MAGVCRERRTILAAWPVASMSAASGWRYVMMAAMRISTILAAVPVAALMAVGISHADNAADDRFWAKIQADGLHDYDTSAQAALAAKVVCNEFEVLNPTWAAEVNSFWHQDDQPQSGWTREMAETFIRDAVNAYCPQYISKVPS